MVRVDWNDVQRARVEDAARQEAQAVIRTVLGTLADRLDRHTKITYRRDTRLAMVIMRNEIAKIVKELDKELKDT